MENYQYISVLMVRRLKLFLAQSFLLISSVFTEQSQKCVKNVKLAMLEQGDLLWQDNLIHCVPIVMKTHIPSTDDPVQEEGLLRRYRERIEKLSQQDRVSKFCTDAGFLTTVEVGEYFMTKDTEEFSQFAEPVTCRENTLPRDDNSTDRHEFEQQRAGNRRDAVRRLCIEIECTCFFASRSKVKAKPQRRISASSSTKTIYTYW